MRIIKFDNIEFNDNDQFNRYLLYKYLKQEYISNNLTEDEAEQISYQLILKYKDNLFGKNGLSYQLGKRNLKFFCMYYLQQIFCGHGCATIAPIHRKLWKEIQDIILYQHIDQKGYILPRGTGKSSFGTLAVSIWTACYGTKKMIVICSSTGKLAKKFLSQIKETIQGNKFIEKSFDTLINIKDRNFKNNEDVLQLSNDTQIEAYGSESSLRGVKNEKLNMRPDLILLDDYQDSKIDVKTEQGRDNKWDRYSSDLKYCKQRTLRNDDGDIIVNGTVILAFGTIQHQEDFYMRLYNSLTWSFTLEKGVLVDNIDELFEQDLWQEYKNILKDTSIKNDDIRVKKAKDFYISHKSEMSYPVLWESFWDKTELAKDYFENPSKFKQEVQSDLNSIGTKLFTTIISKPKDYIEDRKFSKCILGIDPAGITNKNTKKADSFAFCVLGKSGEIKYVRKGELLKFNNNSAIGYEEYIQHTLQLLRDFPEISVVYVEKNTYGGFDVNKMKDYISKDSILSNRDIQWVNEGQHKNKDDKIQTIVSDINMGKIIFNTEDKDFIEQIHEFAGCNFSEHDDAPDILSEVSRRIDDIQILYKVTSMDIRKLF
ncbi:hypothetical protein [Clostridium pasteurianum]|uniref:Uncharacterized protein n=1 Tax=Clostridium pasteurianum BC1 TaxID=86416 RepID=R4K3D1_CLOPA|nr:hypothetical protein [Clostridium pasteurianum]AGK97637.1 hypothetical protein Clopa_2799 [Clostridium pasteurianum BC1]